jgi:hypothetical protein
MSTKSYSTDAVDRYLASRTGLDSLISQIPGDRVVSRDVSPQETAEYQAQGRAEQDAALAVQTHSRAGVFSADELAELSRLQTPQPVYEPMEVIVKKLSRVNTVDRLTVAPKPNPAKPAKPTTPAKSWKVLALEQEIEQLKTLLKATVAAMQAHPQPEPEPDSEPDVQLVSQAEVSQSRFDKATPTAPEFEYVTPGEYGLDELDQHSADMEGDAHGVRSPHPITPDADVQLVSLAEVNQDRFGLSSGVKPDAPVISDVHPNPKRRKK